jgi:hypothetical protein
MTDAERLALTSGAMAVPFGADAKLPDGAAAGAGFVAGVPRLGIPALTVQLHLVQRSGGAQQRLAAFNAAS